MKDHIKIKKIKKRENSATAHREMRKHYMWTWRKENALSWIPRKEIHCQMEEKKKLSNRERENGKSMH